MTRAAHRYLGIAIAIGAVACKGDGAKTSPDSAEAPAKAEPDRCKDAPAIGWLGAVAKDPKALEGAGGGWVSFFQRDYLGAIERFEAAGQDPAAAMGRARAHLRLGVLYRELGHLVARAQADYLAARRKLGARTQTLRKAAYFEGVSLLLGKDPEAGAKAIAEVSAGRRAAPAVYKALARAWPTSCDKPKARTAMGQVAWLVRCHGQAQVTCPEDVGRPPNQDPWKTRVALYHAALCAEPKTVDEARLRKLASKAADTEALKGKGGIDAQLEYFDPVALWALSQLHLRLAEAGLRQGADKALVQAWAAAEGGHPDAATKLKALDTKAVTAGGLVLADAKDAAGLVTMLGAAPARPGADALAKMHAAAEADAKAVDCAASPAGKKVVGDLGLSKGFSRAGLRRAARPLIRAEQTCAEGLRLLRATQDIESLEALSYVNEPSFMVSLAEAALCMNRSAEAIGALKAVKAAYPAAEAALVAAEGLSIVRLMGGTGGTQKIQ